MKKVERQKSKVESRNWLLLACSLVLLFPCSLLFARTATSSGRPHGRRFDVVYLAKNQWRMPVSNYGMFGHDAARGSAGGEWPRGSGNMYIFGAGLWFGRRANNNADTNVTVGYNPNSGKSEFTPGAWDNAPGGYSTRDFERVYSYPEDWPPNPSVFPSEMQDSVLTPLRIAVSGGDTIRGYFYPIPRKPLSTGDLWTVYNDRDVTNMEPHGAAIGLEVYQSTYVWNMPSNRDIIFFSYTIKNVTADTIKDAYMGIACDGDIGGAANDWAGLILHKYIHNPTVPVTDSLWVDNVGMEWSETEPGWPTFPGVLAFDFFQSPFKRQPDGHVRGWPDTTVTYPNGLDDNLNGLIDEPAEGEQIGMTAYKLFSLLDGDPAGDGEQYLALQGREWANPEHPLNPYDSLVTAHADMRFLQSTGPFILAPDSAVTVTVGAMAAPLSRLPSDRDTSFWRLAITDNAAQQVYNNNWLAPQPPPSPGFSLLPGDGKVTIVWDNKPESFRDPYYPLARASDPFFREQDFEGYKLYRSLSGKTGDWSLLAQCDMRDGIMFEDTTAADSIRIKAFDTGLFYSYTDSANIRFGFPYYYAVASYGINMYGTRPDTLPLESGMLQQAVISRTQPSNYRPPSVGVSQSFGNPDIKVLIQPVVVAPQAIRRETLEVRFLPIAYAGGYMPRYSFCILHENGDTAVGIQGFSLNLHAYTDTTRFSAGIFDSVITRISYDTVKKESSFTRNWLPALQVGVMVKMDSIPEQTFDSIHVQTGSYPSRKFGFPASSSSSGINYIWPFRGCAYRIAWTTAANGRLTAEVTDLVINDLINFRVIPTSPSRPESAMGWCFYDSLSPSKLRVPADTVTPSRTKTMIINGSVFEFNHARTIDADTMPAVGDTWIVYPLRFSPAPANAIYRIATNPLEFLVTRETLDVKVVPNPYLVTSEWERHPDFRKLKFINLPNDCTIRIYTMAGELIRTLKHHETNAVNGSVLNQQGGDEDWDLLSEAGQRPAPGIYIFHIQSVVGEQIGKFAVVY